MMLHLTIPLSPKIIRYESQPEFGTFLQLLITPNLAKLNIGIFILHAIFTASFIVIPLSLLHFAGLATNQQWILYLPTLIVALVIVIFCIGAAERHQHLKFYFLLSILKLVFAEFLLWMGSYHMIFIILGLGFFFTGFSLLESFLPSLISRTAPAGRKGSAMGIYSCSQFLGIFVGGILGGWLYSKFSYAGVYFFCIVLALFWFVLALLMQAPRYLILQTWQVLPSKQQDWHLTAAKLKIIPGIAEVSFIAEEGVAYLKMERSVLSHPDFIRLKKHTIGITV
jgi:predicted MFS family arabinose efflux permease